MPVPTPRRRRPRPVADLPLADLDAIAASIAKGWLLELIDAAPLESAEAVPAGPIAAEGPLLAEAMLRALGSDPALSRLEPGGDLEPLAAAGARLAGASEAAGAVRAVELLRGVMLAGLTAAGAGLDPGDAAAVTERATLVAASVAAAAAAAAGGAAVDDAATGPPRRPALSVTKPGSDRRAGGAPAAQGPIDLQAVRARASASAADAAGEGGRPLWVVALERQVAAAGRFALLLVEVDGADKLRASSGEAMFARVGRAIRDQVRRVDLIAHEPDGRAWVVSPDCGRLGAEALAERLATAVERVAAPRGKALTASIGISYFPDDGRDGDSLIAFAEQQMFAARASGVRVIGEPSGDGGDDDDDQRSGPQAAG
jgi:GGDEF domain-containing protein